MIKLLLADDHKMFIDGLKVFLQGEADMEVVGEALNGKEVLEILDKQAVDVVILDVEMPEMDGIETTKQINTNFPHVKVLICSMHNKKAFSMKLLEAGIHGYILKNRSKEELRVAIRNVFNNKKHISLHVIDEFTKPPSRLERKKVNISDREMQVLCLTAKGLTAKEIAETLYLSVATINSHRRNLLRKLELRNAQELTAYVYENDLCKGEIHV